MQQNIELTEQPPPPGRHADSLQVLTWAGGLISQSGLSHPKPTRRNPKGGFSTRHSIGRHLARRYSAFQWKVSQKNSSHTIFTGQVPGGHRQKSHETNRVGIYYFLLCCRCYVPVTPASMPNAVAEDGPVRPPKNNLPSIHVYQLVCARPTQCPSSLSPDPMRGINHCRLCGVTAAPRISAGSTCNSPRGSRPLWAAPCCRRFPWPVP